MRALTPLAADWFRGVPSPYRPSPLCSSFALPLLLFLSLPGSSSVPLIPGCALHFPGYCSIAVGALCVLSLSGIATHSAYCSYLVSSSHPPPSELRGFGVRAVSGAAMTQWVGDNWRLKAGPQPDPAPNNKMPEGPAAEIDPQLRHNGYKESFVQEYDGIKVYHHQGRYQHLGPQVYTWAFYEYRMVINSECWNIIVDENMKEVRAIFQAPARLN